MNPSKRPLDPHQRSASRFIRSHAGCAGVFMAPGTGKTLVAIRYALVATTSHRLIVCRRDDYLTWRDELRAEGHHLHTIESGSDEFPSPSAPVDWIAVTYDLLKNKRIAAYITSTPFEIVIADECHSAKRMKAQRTKLLISTTRHIPRRLGLTGTPITNELLDIFSQALFIDDGRTFGRKEWDFRKRYYMKSGPGWYRRHNAKEQITERMKQFSFSIHEDDVLNLPRIRRIKKGCPMTGIQRRHYERVLEDWEQELADGSIQEMDHVIVQVQKLRQLASGFVYEPHPDGWRTTRWFRNNKLPLLESVIEEFPDSKIVISCAYAAEVKRIAELLPGALKYHGSMTARSRIEARQAFRDTDARFFVSNADMLVGMNELTSANVMVHFSRSTKVVASQQGERRIRRRGSEYHPHITYIDILTENTIDERVLDAVNGRMDLASWILRRLKDGRSIRSILAND